MFSKQLNLSSNKMLGKKLRKDSSFTGRCYICRDLYCNLQPLLKLMLEHSSKYNFETFMVGTQIKPSIVDRDDLVRSKFKLRGAYSIKTDFTRELSKRFSKKTKKTPDPLDPDLTFTINIKDEICQIRTKPVIVQGSYTKTKRGLPQKQRSYENCSGRERPTRGPHDTESIEGMISRVLFSKFGCTTIKFTWVGGEDRSSLVLGTGRPFFAKLQNPIKRHPKMERKTRLGAIILHDCKILDGFPRVPIKFFSTIRIRISTTTQLDSAALQKLKPALRHPVIVYEDGKRSEKSILRVRYKKISSNNFVLTVDAEGGLPVKRFVHGDDVSPGISQILDAECRCVWFDFMQIRQLTSKSYDVT